MNNRRHFFMYSLLGLSAFYNILRFKKDLASPVALAKENLAFFSEEVVVDIKIQTSRVTSSEKNSVQFDWLEREKIDSINDQLFKSGELISLTTDFDHGIAHFTYKFKNLLAKEKWSRMLTNEKAISLVTKQKYIISCNAGISSFTEISTGKA